MITIYDVSESLEYATTIIIPKIDNNYIYWSSTRANIGVARIYAIGY
ncbi:hypothetical protein [uncultured Fusobacterium sp.]|nr:hypothetical protein [uncultured Fusobacterium sp.]